MEMKLSGFRNPLALLLASWILALIPSRMPLVLSRIHRSIGANLNILPTQINIDIFHLLPLFILRITPKPRS